MIKIAVINESKLVSDAQIKEMLPALEKQWNRDLASAWRVEFAELTFVQRGQAPPDRAWWLVWLDHPDTRGLAVHDLTDQGLPISKVFVEPTLAAQASLSVAASHELCEMAVDPTINLAAQDRRGTFWAYEVADPVEDDLYGYEIEGVLVSDFVLPAWFGFKSAAGPFDFCEHCTDAFQILPGGYAQEFTASGWHQLTSRQATKDKALRPPPGSRRERRARGADRWSRSKPLI